MSQIVKANVRVLNRDLARRVADQMGFLVTEDAAMYRMYIGGIITVDEDGTVTFDDYQTAKVDKYLQSYSLELIRDQAKLLEQQGYTVHETVLDNGDVVVEFVQM